MTSTKPNMQAVLGAPRVQEHLAAVPACRRQRADERGRAAEARLHLHGRPEAHHRRAGRGRRVGPDAAQDCARPRQVEHLQVPSDRESAHRDQQGTHFSVQDMLPCLLATLAQSTQVTPAVRAAWTTLFDVLANMIDIFRD